jgi:hypothetical protein
MVSSARDGLTVVAATWLEARACRRALPGWRVAEVGVGGSRFVASRVAVAGSAVVVGLCGALAELSPGTVSIPWEVATPDGRSFTCRPELVGRLIVAARRLGLEVAEGRQLTAPALVTGPERALWAARGFATVDMEAALVLARRPGAVVRVVLDTPRSELSADWGSGARAALRPSLWPELLRLGLRAPRLAARAAAVVASADLDAVAPYPAD